MLLDLHSLNCFVTVAELLSFRLAAGRLALSPAALSDRIHRLEAQLGEGLFHRTTRKVRLTACGERLLPLARQLLEGNDRFLGLAKGKAVPPRVELLLGTRYELGLSWLVPGLAALGAHVPNRILHLHFGEGLDLLDRVQRGLLDGAVTSAPIVGGALDFQVLHPEAYVVVGSAAVLARRPVRGPEDVLTHTLLDLTPDLPLFRYFLDQVGGSRPWRFAASEFLGTIGAVRLRLLQGNGLAVLPRYFVAEDLAQGRLRRVLRRVPLRTDHFRLVWRRDHARAEALQALGLELRKLPLR